MTDATSGGVPASPSNSLLEQDTRTRKRNAAEARFKIYGIVAIAVGLAFLVILLTTIISNGTRAFTQTFLTMDIVLEQEAVDAAEASFVKTSKYREIITSQLEAKIAE
ncbi:MAG: DUF3333 domain-containing protein, partial [Pseudomonadota bacterium]